MYKKHPPYRVEEMKMRTATSLWEGRHPPGQVVLPTEQTFPNLDPKWDNNDPRDKAQMQDLRELIIKGIKKSTRGPRTFPRPLRFLKKKETPSAFPQRPRDQMRKHSALDPEDPTGHGLFEVNFVTKSWPDITKLQKLRGWSEKPIEELLRPKRCL